MKVRELIQLLSEKADQEDEVRLSVVGIDCENAFVQGDGNADGLTPEKGYIRLTGTVVFDNGGEDEYDDECSELSWNDEEDS